MAKNLSVSNAIEVAKNLSVSNAIYSLIITHRSLKVFTTRIDLISFSLLNVITGNLNIIWNIILFYAHVCCLGKWLGQWLGWFLQPFQCLLFELSSTEKTKVHS